MKLTNEERVLRTIKRESIDYLPSNIIFTNRLREKELATALGLTKESELDDYLDNHLFFTSILQDKLLFFIDVKNVIEELHLLDFANPDWKNNIIYDSWGMGFEVGKASSYICFHPLQGNINNDYLKFMPTDFSEKVLFSKDIETAVKLWYPPNIYKPHNFDDFKRDIKEKSGNFLVLPSGYMGIYERAYGMIGWEEFMVNILYKPKVVEELLEKITDYKVEHAKMVVKLNFKIAHHGDDFGTQISTVFSKDIFRKIIKPKLKRVWDIFNNARIPIMLHSCGNVIELLPDLIDIGLNILEPVQPCMDLNYLKKEFGKYLIFYGGIDTQKLPFLSPEGTKELVRNTIRVLGKDGGYIIAPSQEIMNDVPIENIKAMVDTIKEERLKALNL